MKVYCGIDWSERHNDVALINQDGQLVAKKRIDESVQGFAQLIDMLAGAGDCAVDPIPVAIETPRGLLFWGVAGHGRPPLLVRLPGGGSSARRISHCASVIEDGLTLHTGLTRPVHDMQAQLGEDDTKNS